MLHHLTNYLLQYKSVGIPHVGRLRFVQQPAVLNIADKTIEPPSYGLEVERTEHISDHQWLFLQQATNANAGTVQRNLQEFGDAVKNKITNGGFDWEGLGVLKDDAQNLVVNVAALQPVIAEKVIRQNAAHSILIGDRETTSAQLLEQPEEAPLHVKRRAASIVIGWVILILALLAIGVLLYIGKFNVNATGSRLSPASWIKLNP